MLRKMIMALALSLVCSAPAYADSNIAIIDLGGITANSDMGKAADKVLEKRFNKEATALEKQQQALQKDIEKFQKQSAAMSEDARMKKGRELQGRMQEFQKKEAELNQRINPVKMELQKELLAVLNDAISTIAKDKGYDIILNYNPGLTPYASEKVNVSEDVLKEANKLWKKQGSKFKLK